MAKKPTRAEIETYIRDNAPSIGIDPDLAIATMDVESSGNPEAESDTGAKGLFQLFPDAASDAGFDYDKVKRDWKTNSLAGMTYLKQKLDQAGGHVPTALGYYNQGKGGFDKQLKSGNFKPEVVNYLAKPQFSQWVGDNTQDTANPMKAMLAKQQNANKFDRGALLTKNIANQPTQADIAEQQANPNIPMEQQQTLTDLTDELRRQREATAAEMQKKRDEENKYLQELEANNKRHAYTQAANFVVASLLGNNRNPNDFSSSGVGIGRKSVGAPGGFQANQVLGRLQQQVNPNAFNSRFGGGS